MICLPCSSILPHWFFHPCGLHFSQPRSSSIARFTAPVAASLTAASVSMISMRSTRSAASASTDIWFHFLTMFIFIFQYAATQCLLLPAVPPWRARSLKLPLQVRCFFLSTTQFLGQSFGLRFERLLISIRLSTFCIQMFFSCLSKHKFHFDSACSYRFTSAFVFSRLSRKK